MPQSKRYRQAAEKVKKECVPLSEAVAAVKASATAKFDETIELAANLGIDPRHADQQVRGTVTLPKGTGKKVRVAVFAAGEDAESARQAGADVVGAEDLAEKIQGGFLDFDVTLATPDMMRHVGKLGRVLGPRGLMPNPKTGTVTKDIAKAVEEFKGGKIEYRANREGVLHVPVGKASFALEDLLENVRAMIRTIVRARPSAAKGTYIRSLTLSSTMGPGVRIDPSDASTLSKEA